VSVRIDTKKEKRLQKIRINKPNPKQIETILGKPSHFCGKS